MNGDDAQPQPASGGEYDKLKERARARNAELSRKGRDIGELPEVVDPERRAKGLAALGFFLKTYHPETFYLPWSKDHQRLIATIEEVTLRGGLHAIAMPRGSGKTSICEGACEWATFRGAHPFVALIGSDKPHAAEMLASIKTDIETNDLLLEDFPEICYPVRCLEGITNLRRGQLHLNTPTRISWTKNRIVLPTIAGSAASGAIIQVAGLMGRVRGMKFKRADGRDVRPSLVIPDDPQTDQSAKSDTQCDTRRRILAGAVLGMAGPGKKMSGVMPCTVVRAGDMADRILDRKEHPEWQGVRCKMLYELPSNEALWEKYAEIRRESLRAGRGLADATEFYREHREAMDAGAVVAWPERFNHDELSAVQHAMNLKLADEHAFWSEYQNEPLVDELGEERQLTADEILAKLNGLGRGQVPIYATHLTSFIDVHDKLLYWVVAAWGEGFRGAIIDYDTYPKQQSPYFTLRNARRSMGHAKPGAGKEAAILAGLEVVIGELMGREWIREDGSQVQKIRMAFSDAGYKPDTVHSAIRRSPYATTLVMPSLGDGIKAINKPFSEYEKRQGDRYGHYWRIPGAKGKRKLATIHMDTNYWKAKVRDLWRAAPGEPKASLEIFGKDPKEHRMFADHGAAEKFTRVKARGRTVDEYALPPSKPDNHWGDGTVGVAVGASALGLALPTAEPVVRRRSRRRRVRYLNL